MKKKQLATAVTALSLLGNAVLPVGSVLAQTTSAQSGEVSKATGEYQVSLNGEELTIHSEGADWVTIVNALTVAQRNAKKLVLTGTFAAASFDLSTPGAVGATPNVNLPEVTEVSGEVVQLPGAAFKGMTNLKVSTLKASTVGPAVFANTGMTSFDFDTMGLKDIPDFLFMGANQLTRVTSKDVTKIGQGAFMGSEKLEEADFPKTTEIGAFAFSSSGIAKALFPKATDIGNYAFLSSKNLAAVDFTAATTLGENVFNQATALTTIDLKNAVTIGGGTFYGATNLTSVNLPKVTQLNGEMFADTKVTNLVLDNVETMSGAVFRDAKELTTISMNKVKNVSPHAFANTKVTKVTFENATEIENNAFFENKMIEEVHFKNVETVQSKAFFGASNLKKAEFEKLKNIPGEDNFRDLPLLENIHLTNVVEIGDSAFMNSGLKTADLPNVQKVGTHAFYNTKIENISLPAAKEIGNQSFSNSGNLKSISLPEVTKIDGELLTQGEAKVVVFNRTNQALFADKLKNVPASLGVGLAPAENVVVDKPGSVTLKGVSLINPTTEKNFAPLISWTKDGKATGVTTNDYVINQVDAATSGAYQASIKVQNGGTTVVDQKAGVQTLQADVGELDYTVALNGEVLTIDSDGADWEAIVKNLTPQQRAAKKLVLNGSLKDMNKKLDIIDLDPSGSESYDITIARIQTLLDAQMTNQFSNLEELTGNITNLPSFSFTNQEKLAKVNLPNLTHLGEAVFASTPNLNDVTVSNLDTAGRLTFFNSGLKEIHAPQLKILSTGFFWNTQELNVLDIPSITEIRAHSFVNSLKDVKKVKFEHVTLITGLFENGDYATRGAFGLSGVQDIEMPELKTIQQRAFSGAANLKTLKADKAESVGATAGENVFNGTAITALELPALKTIGANAFNGAANLKTLKADKAESVGATAFNGTAITALELPALKTIGANAFKGNTTLTTFKADKAESVGATAFNGTAITALELPALKTIGANAFNGNTTLTTFKADNVTTVGDSAFSGTSVKNLNLDKVTSIGQNAFENSQVETISAKALKVVGNSAFRGAKYLKGISLPSATSVGIYAFNWVGSKLPAGTECVIDLPNVVTLPDQGSFGFTVDAAHPGGITEVNLPKAEIIGTSLFINAPKLQKVTLSNAKTIKANAFENTPNLKVLNLPKVKTFNGVFLAAGEKKVVLFDRTNQTAFEAQLKNVKGTLGIGLAPNEKVLLDKTGNTTVQGVSFINQTGTTFAPTVAWTKNAAVTNVTTPNYVISNGGAQDVGAYQASVTVKEGATTLVDHQHAGIQTVIEPVAITGMNVTAVPSLSVGATHSLAVQLLPANTTDTDVTYESMSPGVATVDENGVIKAVKSGIATIKVTSKANPSIVKSAMVVVK